MLKTGDFANPPHSDYNHLSTEVFMRYGLTERQAVYALHLIASWRSRGPGGRRGWWHPMKLAIRKAKEQR